MQAPKYFLLRETYIVSNGWEKKTSIVFLLKKVSWMKIISIFEIKYKEILKRSLKLWKTRSNIIFQQLKETHWAALNGYRMGLASTENWPSLTQWNTRSSFKTKFIRVSMSFERLIQHFVWENKINFAAFLKISLWSGIFRLHSHPKEMHKPFNYKTRHLPLIISNWTEY